MNDPTERIKTSEDTHTARDALEAIVNHMPVAICLISGTDLRLKMVNPAYQAIAPGKTMIGKTLDELWGETGQNFAALCRRVLETGEPYHVEDELNMIRRRPDGPLEPACFSWSLVRVRLPGSEGWGVLNSAVETTERKRVEDSLRESETRFRSVLESSQDVIYRLNLESGRYDYISPSVETVVGYTPEELMAGGLEGVESLFHPDDLPLFRATLARLHTTGREEVEYRQKTKGGVYRWYSNRMSLVRDASGKPVYRGGIIRDITERKEAERAIAYQSTLLSKVHEGIIGSDEASRITYWNEGMEDIYGFTRDEALGRTSQELLRPIYASGERERIMDDVERTGLASATILTRHKNGTEIVADVNVARLTDDAGKTTGYVVAYRDITERRKLEDLLRRKSEEQQVILDSTPAMIFFKDKENRFLHVNRAFEEAMGRSRQELTAKPLPELYPKEHADKYWMDDLEVMERGEAKRGIVNPVVTPRGTRFFQTDKIPYLDEEGGVRGVIGFSFDITERKLAEDKLRETSDYLEKLINFANAPIICWDPSFRITRFNHAFETLTGHRAEEVIGRDLSMLFPEDSKTESLAKIRRTLTEYWEVVEIPILRKDRSIRIALWNSANIYDEDGTTVQATIAQGQDITERKHDEEMLLKKDEELEKLNRIFKALSESNQAMMRATDEATYMNDVCNIVIRDCGYVMAWIGFAEKDGTKKVRPVAHAGFEDGYLETANVTWADTERGRGPTGRAIRTGRLTICRNMLMDPSFGPWRTEAARRGYASSVAVPLSVGGEVFGALTIYSKDPDPFSEKEEQLLTELADDLAAGITAIRLRIDHDRAVEALAASRNQLQSVIDNTTHLVYILDLEERFMIANKALAQTLGATTESIVGKRRIDLMPREFAEQHEANDRAVIRAGKAIELEETATFGGKDITYLTVKFPLYDARGKIYAIAGLSSDISDRKSAEDVLRRDKETFEQLVEERTMELVTAQIELEKAKRLSDIGVLAATVAHELRNPLAAISMAAHNIRRKAGNPDLEKHLVNIQKKVDESDRIINNLLFYSRLKPPQHESIEVVNLLEDAIGLARDKYKKNVSIVKDIDSLKGLSMEADPFQIREVFNNVLGNAIDAVSADTGVVKIVSEDGGDFIEIRIEDNGVGISNDDLPKVFDPFYTTKAKGTGLGLSVCQQIINQHDGSIRIESELGRGTAVIMRLPKKRKREKRSA